MKHFWKFKSHKKLIDCYGKIDDILRSKAIFKEIYKYQWDYYSELAFQRSLIKDKIKQAFLNKTTSNFVFSDWQRAVKWRYSNHPLSAKGSLHDPGGRFNIGNIDPSRYPPFPAIYIASNRSTALTEIIPKKESSELLSYEELALTSVDSLTIVKIKGQIETAFDLTNENNLDEFVDLIKGFTISHEIKNRAKKLNIETPKAVKSKEELLKTLLADHWRFNPMQYDIPSNTQIFGQIIYESGIEAIIYPSVISKEPCIVVYPTNFKNTNSYVEICDPPPIIQVPYKLDSSTFKEFI